MQLSLTESEITPDQLSVSLACYRYTIYVLFLLDFICLYHLIAFSQCDIELLVRCERRGGGGGGGEDDGSAVCFVALSLLHHVLSCTVRVSSRVSV